MIVLHIDSEVDVNKFDEMVERGNDVFILVYMEGCGPCNATRPEWGKIESALKDQYATNDKLVVVDVNKDFLSKIKHIGDIDGFPTMKYIGAKGTIVEPYENSPIKKKDRSVDSFINWIENKINSVISTVPTSSPHHVYKRLAKTQKQHHKKKRTNKKVFKGGKWSRKYKASINCSKPKGFSQKQYCKYGRKK